MKTLRLLVLVALLFLPLGARAEQVTIDSQNSKLGFKARMLLGSVDGQFDFWTGSINVDRADKLKSSVNVKIDAKSIDTDNRMRDKHLRDEDFFATEKYPEIVFQSRSVTPVPDQKDTYEVVGDLTLRGTTREIKFPAEIREHDGVITAKAKFKIDRQDFGMNYKSYFNPIKDDVVVRFDITTSKPASP
jgi:polyisoprenoid-binding protein YceI